MSNFEYFWSHFPNDIPDRRFMHDALSHSTFRESFDFARKRKRFLQVSHSNCLCHWVVRAICLPFLREAFLPFVRLGWGIERWSVLWDESGLIALLLFSAGSRTTFTQTGGEKLSWRTISLSFVWLDGKTNGQVPQLAALTTGKQRRLPVNWSAGRHGQVIIGWRVQRSEGHRLVAGGGWVVRNKKQNKKRKEKIEKRLVSASDGLMTTWKLITTNKKKACWILTNWLTPSTEYNKNHDNFISWFEQMKKSPLPQKIIWKTQLVNRKNRNKIQLTTNS